MQGVCGLSVALQLPGFGPSYRCADLDVELAHGSPVVHGVESRNFVHTHGRHLQYPCNLVHDADAGEAVLALAEIKKRHDGGLLVLRGVSGDDLLDELLVLGSELEGDRGVVLRRIAVLQAVLAVQLACRGRKEEVLTTMRLSDRAGRETLKARH
jgi:hypothetical protein